jgi:hypothetical protein
MHLFTFPSITKATGTSDNPSLHGKALAQENIAQNCSCFTLNFNYLVVELLLLTLFPFPSLSNLYESTAASINSSRKLP